MKKDLKKTISDDERSLLIESVFKISAIYLNPSYMKCIEIEDFKSKMDSLEKCFESYKEMESKF